MLRYVQAEEKKEIGNKCMKNEQYVEAMFHYTEGVKLDPNMAALYTNRYVCINSFVKTLFVP